MFNMEYTTNFVIENPILRYKFNSAYENLLQSQFQDFYWESYNFIIDIILSMSPENASWGSKHSYWSDDQYPNF